MTAGASDWKFGQQLLFSCKLADYILVLQFETISDFSPE